MVLIYESVDRLINLLKWEECFQMTNQQVPLALHSLPLMSPHCESTAHESPRALAFLAQLCVPIGTESVLHLHLPSRHSLFHTS